VLYLDLPNASPHSLYLFPDRVEEVASQRVLYGRITDQGVPVTGTEIWLRYYDGSSWSTYATTTTNANGDYQFSSLPGLSGDQKYYVRWPNRDEITNWLFEWLCWEISATTTDPSYFRCDFDIDGIDLLSPANSSTVAIPIPQTFTWSKRATTSDSYQ
jgi:hypothetical protein